MKLLYLIYKSCSRFFIREILLMIQVFIVIVLLNAAITPLVNNAALDEKMQSGIPKGSLYYSVPFGETNAMSFIGKLEEQRGIRAICKSYGTSGFVNDATADIVFYNKAVFENLETVLQKGTWEFSQGGVFVNSPLYNDFGNVEYTVTVPEIGFSKTCSVQGVIYDSEIVYDFRASRSEPSIACLGTDFIYKRNTSDSSTDYLVIIPVEDEFFENCEADAAIVVVDPDIVSGDYIQELEAMFSGSFCDLDTMSATEYKRIVETFKNEILIGILLLISTLFGIGGYSYLKVKKLERQMSVYLICGCTVGRCLSISVVSSAILMLIPTITAFCTRRSIVLSEGYDSMTAFLIVLVIVIFAMFMPLLMTVFTFRKKTAIEILHGGY